MSAQPAPPSAAAILWVEAILWVPATLAAAIPLVAVAPNFGRVGLRIVVVTDIPAPEEGGGNVFLRRHWR